MVISPKLRSYALLLVVFLLGGVAGGAGAHALSQRQYARFLEGGRREWMEEHRHQALSRRLGLTSDQQQRVRQILVQHREKRRELARTLLEQCGNPLREERTRINREIRSILTPRQQAHFDGIAEKQADWLFLGPRHEDNAD
jgi:Spy/CpxP family protein refolding chaperone